MKEVSDFLTLLLDALITLAAPVLAAALFSLIRSKYQEIRARVGATRFDEILRMVYVVVRAAEQSGLKGLIENTGESKKEYAVNALQDWLKSKGFSIPVTVLESHVEQAIYDGWQKSDNDGAVTFGR